jgi:acyl-[acyl carrier protein]--UDP-N-acetylglucosamine O-acyltransferase
MTNLADLYTGAAAEWAESERQRKLRSATNTCGGGVDQTAVIGHAPESRDWHPGDPAYWPEVHLTARIEAYVTIDAGLWGFTRIGARSWLMKGCHIGHDAQIGDDCELAPHCVVGGHVVIGDRVRVGIGAMFRPFVKVGSGARIGMGAVVVKDVPPNTLWYGNPAREHPWPLTGSLIMAAILTTSSSGKPDGPVSSGAL